MSKTSLFVVMIVMTTFVMNACVTKSQFLVSSVVPAATGYVKVKNDENNNFSIQIHLSGLAESERLQPSKESYVVWMVTDKELTKNLGQINSSSGMFSKSLKASFNTTTPFKPKKIFITAENDPAISYPGTQVVLTTDRF
jgi:hypothetical protein